MKTIMPSPPVAQGLNKAARLHVGFEVIMRKRAKKYTNDSRVYFDIDDGFLVSTRKPM